MSPRPIFILGPTGSGKSAVALALAERLGRAEIVGADAYQVYRGLSVLTAAPTAQDLACVPHHLIGCIPPTQAHDAAAHARMALAAMADIAARGAVPIVTGGSGLYVKFISHGISPAPPSDPALRAQLTALPLAEVVRRLQEADPEGAAATDLQNPRYVVRNLEIVLLGGKPLAYWRQNWQVEPAGPGICLVHDTPVLDARILRRSRAMLAHGALREVAALPDVLSPTAAQTLGLNTIRDFLAGRIPRSRLVPDIALATRRYAKRQRSWLRREAWLSPLPVPPSSTPDSLAENIFLRFCKKMS